MQAHLQLNCIPCGMELFPAADDDQWTLIERVIDDCDYYIVVVGGRYGSVPLMTGQSYTEMEYRYALKQRKPILGFLHRDPTQLTVAKSEANERERNALDAFRALVKQKPCRLWSTAEELAKELTVSMVQLMNSKPAIGWVRADQVLDKSAAEEILALRNRVDNLTNELSTVSRRAPIGTEGLAQGQDLVKIYYGYTGWPRWESDGDVAGGDIFSGSRDKESMVEQWTAADEASWDEIFAEIAPNLLPELDEGGFKAALRGLLLRRHGERLRINLSKFKDLWIEDQSFQTIKVQLRALGLITMGTFAGQARFSLTQYRDTLMTQSRALKRTQSGAGEPTV